MKRITLFATCLAFLVILLGAYTRLQDAGLGCPDWPGCYGHWGVPTQPEHVASAVERFPDQPLLPHKAWPEMVHRYFAATLGLMILAMAAYSWRYKERVAPAQRMLALVLLILVTLQALLGKYTVTLGLHPGIVMAHLLGGMITLALLSWLSASFFMVRSGTTTAGTQTPVTRATVTPPTAVERKPGLPRTGVLCVVILLIQIALGGWTSANYAARSCPAFPACTENWLDLADYRRAFSLPSLSPEDHGANTSFEYAPHLDVASKMTIHMTHRMGALVTFLCLGAFFLQCMRASNPDAVNRKIALSGLTLLLIQIGLGTLNVLLDLPLLNAVAHNGVAALLLAALTILLYRIYQTGEHAHEPSRHPSSGNKRPSMA